MKRHWNLTILELTKKEFHKSKQPIDLDLKKVAQIAVSNKFRHNGDSFKYFTGCKEGEIIKAICIVLPQLTEYIKYFENGGKTCLS